MESFVDQTDHLAEVLFAKIVAYGCDDDDVITFENTQPTPFRLEKSCVRKWTI